MFKIVRGDCREHLLHIEDKSIDLVKALKGAPCALIAFAKRPFVIAPLTLDKITLEHLLKRLSVEIIPEDGYDLAAAIQRDVALSDAGAASSLEAAEPAVNATELRLATIRRRSRHM